MAALVAVALPQYALLVLLGFAVYARALWLPPTYQDDLKYLTSVSQTANPLIYFISDHGHGNDLYRPLTSVSLWLAYRVFGVWALPNQLVNLLLHITSACLLYRLARRLQGDDVLALLIAAVFLVSPYTKTAATEVADRPMAFVGLFLVLLVDHFTARDAAQSHPLSPGVSVTYAALLSVLALMGKESGVVLPLLVMLLALFASKSMGFSPKTRSQLVIASLVILVGYFVFRWLIFGSGYADYGQAGYMLLGSEHYESLSDLPLRRQMLAVAEIVGKNLLAPIFPVFDDAGRLLTTYDRLAGALPLIFATMLLFRLGANRGNGRLQLLALATIVLSALVHSTLFRYRLQYLSEIAYCLFLIPRRASQPDATDVRHARMLKGVAVVLLVVNLVWVSQSLSATISGRAQELATYRLSLNDLPSHVDERIVLAVLNEYH